MKKVFASFLMISTVALSGCTYFNESTANEVAAGAATGIPRPDSEQEAKLREDLAEIDPALNNEKAFNSARNQCTDILGGMSPDKLILSTQARFEGAGVETVTERDAKKILDVIKNNGFCK